MEEAGGLALRKGPWKLIAGKNGGQLYNLDSDIGEKNDVSEKHPEVEKEMSGILARIREKGLRYQSP